jgi:hypothetical protein
MSDKRAEDTCKDVGAVLHETIEIPEAPRLTGRGDHRAGDQVEDCQPPACTAVLSDVTL